MTIYYASITGDNSNPGTLASPFRTFQKGIDVAVNPGDAVLGLTGNYFENAQIKYSGSAGMEIKIASAPGHTATIDGGAGQALGDTVGCHHIDVSGLILKSTADSRVADFCLGQSHFPTGSSDDWHIHGNVIYGHTLLMGANNLIENNTVYGENTLYDGFREYSAVSHHNTYRNNEVSDCLARGFWTDHYTHDGLWEYNLTTNCRSGFDADGYGNIVWLHTMRFNTVAGSSESGFQLENTWASLIENNRISDTPVGVDVINYGATNDIGHSPHIELVSGYGDASDGEGKITSTIIRQNVIFDVEKGVQLNRVGGISIIGNQIEATDNDIYLFAPCPELVLKDNISAGPAPGLFTTGTIDDIIEDNHNLFAANPAYEDSSGTFTLSAYQTASGLGVGSIIGDPLLAAHIPGIGSPAIDAGTNTGMSTDIAGTIRPQGAGYDIGAYEFVVEGGETPATLDGDDRIAVQDVSATRRIFATIGELADFLVASGGSIAVDDSSTTVDPTTQLTFNPAFFDVSDLTGGQASVDFIGGAADIPYTPTAPLTETNLQDALDEVGTILNTASFSSPDFGAGVIKTLASDVVSAGSDRHLILAAQTGTADNCIEVTGLSAGEEVILRADAGDTITVKHNDAGATDKIILYNGADLVLTGDQTLKLVKIASGKVVQYVDEKGTGGGGSSADYLLYQDQKAQNTQSGSFTSAAWRTRDLNTEVADPGGHGSVASNQITLAAGTYAFRASCPAYHCELHQARLQNITDTATLQYGTSAYANATSAVMNTSEMTGYFTIAGTKVLELQHRCSQTQNNDGFGTRNNQGTEVYAQIEFWKVA